MKIEFNKVIWKNFLSYGNNVTEFSLDKHKTSLIIGKNGSGKSTIIDVICFNLFGKAFRNLNKGDLVNSINGKDLYTELLFNKGKTSFRVIRGIKPNIFQIWKNDVLLPEPLTGDYQDILEAELGFNIKTFKQIALIGKASYVPFMQQKPADRRDMVEDLLDIKVFSHMNVIVKERLSKIKTEIQILESQIENIKKAISAVEDSNDEFKKDILKDISKKEEQIQKCIDEIEVLSLQKETYKKVIEEASKKLESKSKYDNNIKKLVSKEKEIETYISVFKKEIEFFNKNKNCPSCKQDINPDHKHSIVLEKQNHIKEQESFMDKLEEHFISNQNKLKEINLKEKEIETHKNKLYDVETKISVLNSEIKFCKSDLVLLKKKIDKKDKNTKELKTSLAESETMMNEVKLNKEYLETVYELLKDGGIKTQIIKKYIPIMNKLINKYLASMDFFVNFEIDEEFNETIKSRYRDKFKYQNFSEGEKLRIDLAILFAWRTIAKNRNSVNSNILFLDEIFESSLDDNGTDEFLKILNDLTDGTNTFIVSHKSDQLFDKFEKVYKFEKHQSFSRLVA